MTGFQKQVNLTPAPAVAGDFASANPRAVALAGPNGLVAGSAGVTVGKFAWIDTDEITVRNYGTGTKAPSGFVHNEMNAVITNYLGESSMVIPAGFPVTLFANGDFWVVNSSATAATPGTQVYADYSNGDAYLSAPTGASVTGSIGATFTATGSTTNLTVAAVTGVISVGDVISGTGVPTGTTIVSQTSGTTGGAGVYVTSAATTASAATVTAFGTVLTVTVVGSGTLEVGDAISGSGVPSGAVISSQISGSTGGVGSYRIYPTATAYAASTTVTAAGGVLTPFYVRSSAAAGELMKISTWS